MARSNKKNKKNSKSQISPEKTKEKTVRQSVVKQETSMSVEESTVNSLLQDVADLKKAIILSEVIGKPRCKARHSRFHS